MLWRRTDSSKKTGLEKKKSILCKIRENDEVQHPKHDRSPTLFFSSWYLRKCFSRLLRFNPRLENQPIACKLKYFRLWITLMNNVIHSSAVTHWVSEVNRTRHRHSAAGVQCSEGDVLKIKRHNRFISGWEMKPSTEGHTWSLRRTEEGLLWKAWQVHEHQVQS